MRIAGFDWDEGNRPKCQKHGVSSAAIEELFRQPIAVLPDPMHSKSEERFEAMGKTNRGRGILSYSRFGCGVAKGLFGRSAPATCTKRKWTTMKKKLPRFKSDKAAEKFVEKANLTDYDLSGMRPIRFEFQPKGERVNMRLPRQLLDAVRASAAKAGVPYQRFIRQALEDAVQRKRA
jgi:predicted DNA binding CopG/RHH family protein